MHKGIGTILLTGGAAALMIGLVPMASFAAPAPTFSVSPGGSFTGTKSGHFTLTDTTTGKSILCTHSSSAGTFKSGTKLPGAGIGSITSLALTSCTTPSGGTVNITAGHLPWTLNAVSFDKAVNGGTTTGTVTGIHATLSGPKCQATVDGTGAAANDGQTGIHYHNTPGKLTILTQGSNLHAYGVTGCLHVIKTGDPLTLSIGYLVTPKQTIK